MRRMGSRQEVIVGGEKLVDSVWLVFPNLHLHTNAAQWYALHDIADNLLLATDIVEQESNDRMETFKYRAQLNKQSEAERVGAVADVEARGDALAHDVGRMDRVVAAGEHHIRGDDDVERADLRRLRDVKLTLEVLKDEADDAVLDDHLLGNARFAAELFEGMRGMDRKELGFRLLAELALAALLAVGAARLLDPVPALLLGLAAAHSLSFTLNGRSVTVDVDPRETLFDTLREQATL